jgi:hypothetical protein
MIYPETFGRDPVLAVKDTFGVIAKYEEYADLPVTVWVGSHSLQDSASLLKAVPTIFDRSRRVEGLVLWRYGDDVMREKEFAAVRQLTIPDHVPAPRPTSVHVKRAQMKLREGLRQVAYRTQLIRVLHRLRKVF